MRVVAEDIEATQDQQCRQGVGVTIDRPASPPVESCGDGIQALCGCRSQIDDFDWNSAHGGRFSHHVDDGLFRLIRWAHQTCRGPEGRRQVMDEVVGDLRSGRLERKRSSSHSCGILILAHNHNLRNT